VSYTFSGQTLDNTYHRVLQVVNEALLDGTGTPTSLAVMGSFSANTIFSGQTNLYDIFAQIGDIGASTYVQPGLNTYTGGTSAVPTVNISAATLSYLSATTISADTIYSGLTPLFSVITGATFLPTTQIAFGNTVSGISSSPRFIYAPTTTATKFEFRDWVGIADYPTIYLLGTGITASVSNYSLTSDGANTYLNAPTGFLSLRNAGNIVAQIDSNGSTFISPLNVSNAFKANSITGTTVSASTFYSGTTPLASIINNIATGATYLPTQQIAFGSSTSGLTGDSQFTYSNSILTINGGGFTAQLGLTNGFSLTVPQGFTFFSPSGILNHSALAHNFYAGNVGIGTAFGYTPTNKLEVIGNVSITGTTKTNSLSATTITVEDIVINNTFNYRESEQETNKILTVDVNGVPKWQYPNVFSSLPFFFTNTASPIVGSYKLMKSNIQLDTLQTISNFSIVDGQLLAEFITESGYPNINFIPAGVSFMHLHAANTNNGKETSLYYEIYKRTTGGTETLIGTSDLTDPLTLTSSETICDVSLTATTLNYSDFIVLKVYGHVVGAGSAPDISLYVEDGTTSRLQIPSFVNDSQNFIPYSGATSDVDLDTQNLKANIITGNTIQGQNVLSGNTDLYNIFAVPVDSPSYYNLTLSGSATAFQFSATTIIGDTILSGSTNLYNIFTTPNDVVSLSTKIQPGSNINTGGTSSLPVISLVSNPSLNGIVLSGSGIAARALSFSATTLSGATIYSASTDLNSVFAHAGKIGVTSVGAGHLNITTGGTDNNPTILLAASPSLAGIQLSGSGISARALSFSATTLSGATLYSGSTDLSSIFAYPSQIIDPSAQGNIQTGGTAAAPIFSVVDSPSFSGLLLSGSGISARALSFSATTLSGATLYSGSTDLSSIFAYPSQIVDPSAQGNIQTGGTAAAPIFSVVDSPSFNGLLLSGSGISARALSFSATTFSGGTLFSGNTNLYSIFAQLGTVGTTYVQPGTNISTGGTAAAPIVNVVDSPTFNNLTSSGTSRASIFSATTISGGTLISGSTNLYNIFQVIGGASAGATTVQPGSNITTGGTASSPIVSVVDSPSFNNLTSSGTSRAVAFSATTVSGSTLYSGSTDLSSVFAHTGKIGVTSVGSQNLNITTGGTDINPTIILASSPSLNGILLSGSGISARALSFSATTLSGATIYSASTDLSSVFAHSGKIGVTSVGSQNLNITTGGTDINPTIILAASPSLNGLTLSGSGIAARALSFSATTLSGSTLYSGSTDLSSVFAHSGKIGVTSVGSQNLNITTGGTDINPTIILAASPALNGLTLSGAGISARALSFSATTLSGSTLYSGSTDLSSIFAYPSQIVDPSAQGNIQTGGTSTAPIFSVVDSPSFNGLLLSGSGISARALSFSATTLSGATLYSGSTDLSSLFAYPSQIIDPSAQGNIQTGGTAAAPIFSVVDSPSFNGLLLSGSGISARALSFSATTLSGATLYSGSTDLSSIFAYPSQIVDPSAQGNIQTGGTAAAPIFSVVDNPSFSGLLLSGSGISARALSFSATTLSGGTLFSGNTNLYSIFAPLGTVGTTYVQPGTNISTGGTASTPIINLVDSPSVNNITISGTGRAVVFSATTISGGTLISGSTNLYNIFQTIGGTPAGATTVQPGSNITTGGTASSPIVNVVDSPSFNNLTSSGTSRAVAFSATTISGGTIMSGSTDLSLIFVTHDNNTITNVQPGTNTTTGGTATSPSVNIVDSPSFNGLLLSGSGISARALSFSATTLSGATIYSASTDLSSVFAHAGKIGVTSVGAGHLNITTGGTDINPTILLATSPSLTGILLSGSGISARALSFSATTLSGSTLYSGSTDLSSIFAYPSQIVDPSAQGNIQTGGTAAAPIFSVVDSPSFSGLLLSGSGISARALAFSATTLSGATLYSGSTDLSSIFAYPSQIVDPSAQGNIQTGGTAAAPIFSVVDSPSFNGLLLSGSGISSRALSFSATTLSGATLYSGSTDLSSVFAHAGKIGVTSVGAGHLNITTGGTDNNPTILLAAAPFLSGAVFSGSGISTRALTFSATTLSGATIYSASTDLSSTFAHAGKIGVTSVGAGHLNITTGGTDINPTILLAASPSLSGIILTGSGISARALAFSATTLSGATLYSGSTDLSSLFAYQSQIVDPSAQGNIQTGGTAAAPIFSVVDSPSFNGLTTSGTSRATSFSATTLSASTLFSGSTNLYSIFAPIGGGAGITAGQSVGVGNAIFKQVNGSTIEIRSISAGTNVTITTGDTITINASAGSGVFAITEAEVDFGAKPVKSKTFTITDGTVTAASKIMITSSGTVATGRVGDDWEWDSINFTAKAASGQFTVTAFASGRVRGARKIFYTIA